MPKFRQFLEIYSKMLPVVIGLILNPCTLPYNTILYHNIYYIMPPENLWLVP